MTGDIEMCPICYGAIDEDPTDVHGENILTDNDTNTGLD